MAPQPDCDVPVLIAGAGPVGLSLAADLAWRGVCCLLVDPVTDVNAHPRAISIGVRSMEHFRRLGLDQQVIDAGVPRDHALDVVYATRMLGEELFRFPIPSIDDLEQRSDELARTVPETAASPYYKTWVAQSPLERVLRRHLAGDPNVELQLGWRLDSFTENDEGATATIVEEGSGRSRIVTARILVGCDGAASTVRAGIGIRLQGKGTLGFARGVYFRAPELRDALPANPGVMYWVLAPDSAGVIYTIGGGDDWVFNRYYGPGESADDNDPVALIRSAIGRPLQIDILSVQDWKPRQLVAESFGTQRVFLAGDACHLFVPTGGFGMNTGIGDAVDLAWKIEAMLAGWGGENLLASYHAERRPIGEQNTREAADNYAKSGELFVGLQRLEDESEAGRATRAALIQKLPPKIKHFAPIGVHLGYCYEDSPLIVSDRTPPPARETATYTPTARPGHRAPHVWLDRGRSTLDLFGRGFVCLCFGDDRGLDDLRAAARDTGLPLRVETIANKQAAAFYGSRFVLVRPDGHVAWRGDDPPADARALLDIVRGATAPRAIPPTDHALQNENGERRDETVHA